MLLGLGMMGGEYREMEKPGYGGPDTSVTNSGILHAEGLEGKVAHLCLAAAWSMDLKNRGQIRDLQDTQGK